MNKKEFWIETYGCQMNDAESEALKITLKARGWREALTPDSADAVILNTCSVRQTAENRLWGRLGFYKHAKKEREFKLTVIGCMAERLKDKMFSRVPEIDLIAGSFQKTRIADYLEKTFSADPEIKLIGQEEYEFFTRHSNNDFKAFVPIMHGCNNFCTYCIVPYVRGREISRSFKDIYNEIDSLDSGNVKEITLLGQNVNSYTIQAGSRNMDFPALLESVAKRVTNIEWIRFLTSHPKDLSDRVIGIIKDNPVLCNHIHLPVQHGSNKILKLMKRNYTRESYLKLAERIRKNLDNVSLTTDILIGFPGETEEDVKYTMDLIKEAEYEDAFTYYYNPREGTKAYEWGDPVPQDTKIERLNRIIELQRSVTRKKRLNKIGRTMKVLAEKRSKKNKLELLGRTEFDDMVVFPGSADSIGKFINVRIEDISGDTLRGKEL
ncbi:MAG: tRNA (N6-isopentenyl adenosine(37)-C2)-methylthiotransferase MiaB [Spirochaetes bacterium]|nr:tRNA (N6-isopentenyl adenosine(37)-C2)-methylthiotransferase MiaB [Spirochaetota bacterium]